MDSLSHFSLRPPATGPRHTLMLSHPCSGLLLTSLLSAALFSAFCTDSLTGANGPPTAAASLDCTIACYLPMYHYHHCSDQPADEQASGYDKQRFVLVASLQLCCILTPHHLCRSDHHHCEQGGGHLREGASVALRPDHPDGLFPCH